MRETLNVDEMYKLYKTAYRNGDYYEFVIDSVVGYGSTCIVYNAHFQDKLGGIHRCRLKECFPVNAAFEIRVNEKIDWISDEVRGEAINKFVQGYIQHLELQKDDLLVNPMSKITDMMFYGNETQYVVIEHDNGVAFDKSIKSCLHDVLQQIKSLAVVVGKYHERGYLHLDIKPENFMPLPDMNNSVKLFDFDSVVRKQDIEKEEVIISYSKEWAAPEVMGFRKEEICEASDIYSIGCVLYYALLGEAPNFEDFLHGVRICEDNALLLNSNPIVRRVLARIIKKCLSASAKYRYTCVKDFCDDLDKAIILSAPNSCYFEKREIYSINTFAGRDVELQQIEDALAKSNYVFVSGMGGIGKSTLVKEYCKRNKNKYDSIIYTFAANSIRETIIDNFKFPVHNFNDSNKDLDYREEEVLLQDKLKCIESFVDEKVLVVIDNIKNLKDSDIAKLLALKWKIIFITRPNVECYGYNQIKIDRADNTCLKSIFEKSSGQIIDENDEIFNGLLNKVDGHTLIVELIGKQIKASHKDLSYFLEIVNKQGLLHGPEEQLKMRKDDGEFYQGNYAHILKNILFDNQLSLEETKTLQNMAFFPVEGVNINEFQELCKINSCDDINNLIELGWISCDYDNSTIWMHALIREIMFDDLNHNNIKELIRNVAYMYLPIIRGKYPLNLSKFAEKKLQMDVDNTFEPKEWYIEVARELFEKRYTLTTDYAILGFEVAQFYDLNYSDKQYMYQYLEMMDALHCDTGYIEFIFAYMMTIRLWKYSRYLDNDKENMVNDFYMKYCKGFKWVKLLIPIAKKVGFKEFVQDDVEICGILIKCLMAAMREERISEMMYRAGRIQEIADGTKVKIVKRCLSYLAEKQEYQVLKWRFKEVNEPKEGDYADMASHFYIHEKYDKALEYGEIAYQLREKVYAKDSLCYRREERTYAKYLICNGQYDKAISILEPIVLSSNWNIFFRNEVMMRQYMIDLSAELLIEAYREKGDVKKARQYREEFETRGVIKSTKTIKYPLKEYRYISYLKRVPDRGPYDITGAEIIYLPPKAEIIEQYALANCSKLREITIPNTIKSIEQFAFAGCDSLQNIYYEGTLEKWKNIKIGSGNEKLITAKLHTK